MACNNYMVIIIYAFGLTAAMYYMNICLGKVLEKCLNLRMTKQGEPCSNPYPLLLPNRYLRRRYILHMQEKQKLDNS